MQPPSAPTAIVVGAGLAGLAAAVRLDAAGVAVRVVDPEPAGGKARTLEPLPGWRIEWGPHSFLHRAHALWAFAGELGVADQAAPAGPAARARYLVRGGRLRRAPFAALGLRAWAGVLAGLFRRVPDAPDATVHDWFARRFGAAFARGPLDAMMTGIWASDPAAIGMDDAFPRLAAAVRAEGTLFRALLALRRAPAVAGAPRPGTWGFPLGMGTLADAAARRLGPARFLRDRVERVRPTDAGWRVETATETLAADAVVVATDPPAALRLLGDVVPGHRATLEGLRTAPLAVAHWLSADSAFPRGFGFLAAHGEARALLGTIFVSDLFPSRAPAGKRAFATMFGGARRPDDARIDAQEARQRIGREHRALTGREVRIDALEVVHHPHAVAAPAPGHGARMASLRSALPPGLAVAGAWCGAGAMDDAVQSGFDAAAALLGSASGGGGLIRPPQRPPHPVAEGANRVD